MTRKKPTMREALASAYLHIPGLIPEELREASAASIVSAVDLHHWPIPHANGGGNNPQNLQPMLRSEHRRETARNTIPTLARGKRIRRKQGVHVAKMLDKAGQAPPPDPFAARVAEIMQKFEEIAPNAERSERKPGKRKSGIKSRGFQGWRTFSGEVRWKKDRKSNRSK